MAERKPSHPQAEVVVDVTQEDVLKFDVGDRYQERLIVAIDRHALMFELGALDFSGAILIACTPNWPLPGGNHGKA